METHIPERTRGEDRGGGEPPLFIPSLKQMSYRKYGIFFLRIFLTEIMASLCQKGNNGIDHLHGHSS